MGKEGLAQNKLVRLSKFLSYVLRHHPETIGLEPDAGGWVDVKKLITHATEHGKAISLRLLEETIARNEKNRFEFSEDKKRIRARQGHSFPVDSGLSEQKPPEFLYHGTAQRFILSIMEKGLLKSGRLHVHLSNDEETAIKVGRRHGKPVVLKIKALEMYENGYKFLISSNGVWLTEYVPPGFLIVLR